MSSHPSTTIRIASKSVRVPSLLKRILSNGFPFKGLMCFAVEEAEFLCDMGFDDILIWLSISTNIRLSNFKKFT